MNSFEQSNYGFISTDKTLEGNDFNYATGSNNKPGLILSNQKTNFVRVNLDQFDDLRRMMDAYEQHGVSYRLQEKEAAT